MNVLRALRDRGLVAAVAALVCGVLLAGCAGSSDGGPIGTGITASVAGNVVAVVATSEVEQVTVLDVPAVEVSIDEAPGVATTTDAAGNFTLEGDFAGVVTVRFQSAGVEATQILDVPTGGLVVLADVVVAPGQIDAEAGRQVGFLARVESVDCAAGLLGVADDHERSRTFTVALVDDTRIVRRGGAAATCADLRPGERIAIDGVFAPESGPGNDVTALSITLGAERGTRPDVVEDVPFAGFVAAVRCNAGSLTVADASQRTRVRIDAGTTFTTTDGTPIRCGAIAVGDRVAGLGRLRVRQPGTIAATSVVVATGAGPIDLRLSGAVVGKDCAAGVLQLDDGDGVVAVQIGPDTVVQPALTCDEIPLGARVRGLGRVRRALPDVILAVRLEIRRPGR